MKSFLNRFLLLVVLVSTIVGCQKDEINFPDTNANRIEEVRRIFAETLSRALVDEQLRRYIHAKMQLVYNTDYEMVYLAEKSKVIYDGKTLADILTMYADPKVLEANGDDFFMTLTDITPLLAISMPELLKMNATLWDVNIIPKVAAVLDASSNSYILYSRGDTEVGFRDDEYDYYEDDDDYFSDPTLAVWDAEGHYLVKEDGMTSWGKMVEDYMPGKEGEKSGCLIYLQQALAEFEQYEVSGQNFHLIAHYQLLTIYLDCIGEGDGGGNGDGCSEPCERDCESNDETLVDFRINGWGVFRNIRNQAFESRYVFHGDIGYATRNNLGQVGQVKLKMVTQEYRRRDILNCDNRPCSGIWKLENFRVSPDWDLENQSDSYYVDWAEVDNGTTTLTFGATLTAKFKVGDVDVNAGISAFNFTRTGAAIVPLGSQLVYYCDEINRINNTGSIEFRCN